MPNPSAGRLLRPAAGATSGPRGPAGRLSIAAARCSPLRVRVHYPLASGELRLRADSDWERDLLPRRVDRARTRFDFELDGSVPFRHFKPVLEQEGRTLWAQGENGLVLREGSALLESYPHFAPDSSCHVCDEQRVPASFDARGYDLRVFLPPGYGENTLQRFPVLYMQDGQNLFFPEQAPQGKHWRVGETLELLDSMCLIRQVIVVGVYPRDRMNEYTRPGYEAYTRFLADELVPWVDSRYRTLPGARHTAVMGSSLGGVASLHAGWSRPEVFGQVGAMSATFGYRDDLLARVMAERRRPLRIYLDSGWPQDNYEATRSMDAALRARGWSHGRDLLHLAFPEARHEEQAWAARAHLPFQFFFRE
jgi:predicted alpha/beta superfamily hydrolase